jgi:mannose-6-phosphate isomerase
MDVVRGFLQAYDWGKVDGLSAWTPATGGPQAELWFGSHPNGPSPLRDEHGEAAATALNMPILTKILAAARPLSIQIHPLADLARAQFELQRTDPAAPRLLSDPNAKAEILIALEPFVILEGFREPRSSAQVFAILDLPEADAALRSGDLPGAIRLLLGQSAAAVAGDAARLPAAFLQAGLGDHAAGVIHDVVSHFPDDPGLFVAALLNARTLQPGQAVYVDPGTVHAYVRGTGIEVMTNSDNVLRLGLTSKTVAIDAALAALSVDAQPHPQDPPEVDGVRTYAAPGAPFVVRVVSDATVGAGTGVARTVLCLTGLTHVDGVTLQPGEAVLAEAADPGLRIRAEGRTVVAVQAP